MSAEVETGLAQAAAGQFAENPPDLAADGDCLALVGVGTGDATDGEVRPNGEAVTPKPAKATGPTAEELAEYDAETVRRVNAAESLVRAAENEHADLKAAAATAKKAADARTAELRGLIRERQEKRGAGPEKTLLDFAPKAAPKWRALPVDTITMDRSILATLLAAGVKTVGDLNDQIHARFDTEAGPPFGLKLTEVMDLREEVQVCIDREFNETADAEAAAPAIDPELWRKYPLDRWERFGATGADVAKLEVGNLKDGGRVNLATVGDLAAFSTPYPNNPAFTRSFKDIKGIGDAAAERLCDAELAFWKWWNGGGAGEFAAELGVSGATVPGTDGGVSGPGDADGRTFADADKHYPGAGNEPDGDREAIAEG